MEFWSILLIGVKLGLYGGVFLAVGGHLFITIFGYIHSTAPFTLSATSLASIRRTNQLAALGGALLSGLLISVMSANLGGDFASFFDMDLIALVLGSTSGGAIILHFLGLLILFIAGFVRGRAGVAIGLAGVMLAIFAFTQTGHATLGATVFQTGLKKILLAIHLLGVSYWLGTFLPLKRLSQPDVPVVSLAGTAHQFGVYAVVLVAGLIVAGTIYASLLLGSLAALFTTGYGQVLLIKLALVAGLLGLAALNKFRLVPRLMAGDEDARGQLTRSINWEIVLAAGVLLATSLLTTSLTLPMS
jgi:putative copper resistance protein D